MNLRNALLSLGLVFGLASYGQAAIIASNDFDSPVNLTGTTSSAPGFNGFASAGDGWGVYNYYGAGPFALFDDSVLGTPDHTFFEFDSVGIAQSTKTDNFFGIVDTTNGDVTDGEMTGTFTFDISSATGGLTSIDIDFAGQGDFEASDLLTISYSIDGGAFQDIFVSSVDETIDDVPYTMESGAIVTHHDPISINGVQLDNSFQTISAAVSGTGSSLTLQVFADTDGGSEATGFDNIVINGITAIPEPSSFALLGLAVAGLAYRRRSRRV